MQTDCNTTLFEFAPVDDRKVVARFDGGRMTSNAGALLLGGVDKAIGLIERAARCFVDRRDPRLIEHSVATLVGQRIIGLALGYEDLVDHDALRNDPLLAVLAGKLKARRADCAPVAGKSTLNRLERSKDTPSLYHKISHDGAAIVAVLPECLGDDKVANHEKHRKGDDKESGKSKEMACVSEAIHRGMSPSRGHSPVQRLNCERLDH